MIVEYFPPEVLTATRSAGLNKWLLVMMACTLSSICRKKHCLNTTEPVFGRLTEAHTEWENVHCGSTGRSWYTARAVDRLVTNVGQTVGKLAFLSLRRVR